jgi:Na+/H+ antiporter NhaD/arsenite permease-like protein
MKPIYTKISQFFKAETVLCVSGAAAFLTMLIVHPSKAYLSYLDFRVLALLFCLMAVVAGFNETGIFLTLSEKLLKKVVGIRTLSLALVILCFFASMWVTNDVALITFVPFAIMVLSIAGQSKYILRIIILQTIAANLGSMLTPVGNPQNLYLYNYYNVPILEFLKITAPFVAVSLVLLLITVFMIKKEPLSFEVPDNKTNTKNKYLLTIYCGLFLVCLACVLRFLDYRITLVIIVSVILIFNRMILKKVDYALLLTFVFFFIFVGNMGNIPAVKEFLADLIAGKELAVAIGASQLISNVPAAILLSAFTDNYKALILGTDLGGLGTLVASLASLISYKFYCKVPGANPRRYLRIFTGYNLAFLAGLILFYKFGKYVIMVLLFLLVI